MAEGGALTLDIPHSKHNDNNNNNNISCMFKANNISL